MIIAIVTTEIRTGHDVVRTRQYARQIASQLDFDMQAQTHIATAVSEIARNALQHGGGGRAEFQLASGMPQTFQIVICDNGPGVPDVDRMLRVARGTNPEWGRTLRGVRRLMDEFRIESPPGNGTRVLLGKRRHRHQPPIERRDILRVVDVLMQRVSDDPLSEMHRQNQELLHTLEALRVQQEERAVHLQEIETLNHRLKRAMTETHHRVKNNLQVIAALIELQKGSGRETIPVEELTRLSQNIQGLAVIHDILTKEAEAHAGEESGTISVGEVFAKLLPMLEQAVGIAALRYRIEDARLPGKMVTSLTLVLNELVSNAVKHGQGMVEVDFRASGGNLILEILDDGPGFAAGFDPIASSNTGLDLVENMVAMDLHGTTSYTTRKEGGGRVAITFPLPQVP